MASAHSKAGSPYWYAWYRAADGRRVSKATGLLVSETSRTTARRVADEFERLARKARQGSLTAERARDCVSEIFQIVSGEALLFYSAEKWFSDWLQNKAASKTKATMASYGCAVSGFLKSLGPRRRIGVELLTPHDFTKYRDGLIRAKKSPQTANSYVKMLRIPMNVARKQGLISSNPAESVDSLPSDAVARSTFSADQVETLLLFTRGTEWEGVILFGFYTGQRLSDLANLRWENIDLAASCPHLRLKQRKTGREVVVPLAPTLSAWLLARPSEDDPQAFIFPSLAGRASGGDSGLSARFSTLMTKAGFSEFLARGGDGGRKLAALSFHSLRHTFNSIMANEGVVAEIRQKLTGHASEEVHRRYTHHELGTLLKAIDVLPTLGTARTMTRKRGKKRQ